MTTNQVVCIGQYQACALRASRLSDLCVPSGAAGDVVVTGALVSMTMTPEVEQGTRYEPKTGCGAIAYTAEGEDIIKRYTLDLQLVIFDLELVEIVTGSSLLIGDTGTTWPGKTIGYESRGPNSDTFPGASLEIFTRTSKEGGACGDIGTNPQFARHIFPRCKFYIAERTFEDAAAILRLQGWSTPNSAWGQGPVPDEWEADAPLGSNAPYAMVLATALPTTGCGLVSTT